MATRRKSTRRKAGGGAAARQRRGRAQGTRSRGHRSGTRQARPAEAARQVRTPEERSPAEPPGRQPDGPPALRLAEPPPVEDQAGRAAAGRGDVEAHQLDREAAELARRIEATVGAMGEGVRTGPASAAERLGAHREQMEDAAREREAERELPGVGALAVELATGALRLARSMITAPLRIALAFLWRGLVRS